MKNGSTVAPKTKPELPDFSAEISIYEEPYRVTDSVTYRVAVDMRAGARAMLDKIKNTFQPMSDAANEVVAKITRTRLGFEKPLRERINQIDKELLRYEQAAEQQRKKAEIELAAKLEKEAQEQRTIEVQHLARTGYISESKRLAADPLPVVDVPSVPVDIPEVEGFQKRTLWDVEVTDLAALVKAVAEGKVPLEVLEPNLVVLRSLARASKTTLNIPGVKAVSKPIRAQRRS